MKKKRKMGMVEIVKHDLVDTYPVLFEKEGETIVQFKFTALLLQNSTEKLNTFPLPHVTSEFSVETDPEIQAILAMSTKRKKKPKKRLHNHKPHKRKTWKLMNDKIVDSLFFYFKLLPFNND